LHGRNIKKVDKNGYISRDGIFCRKNVEGGHMSPPHESCTPINSGAPTPCKSSKLSLSHIMAQEVSSRRWKGYHIVEWCHDRLVTERV
jgi:hypothetical protein